MPLPAHVNATTDQHGRVRGVRGPIPLPVSVADDGAPGDVAAGVVQVLSEYAGDLQIAPSETIDLTVTKVTEIESTTYVRLAEAVGDTPVYGSDIVAEVRDNAIQALGVARHEDRVSDGVASPTGDSQLTMRRAINLAKRLIGVEEEETSAAIQVYFPARDGLHLAWQVDVFGGGGDWRYVVDAASEEVYVQENRLKEVDGQGRVFLPNPVVTANDNTFREGITPEATLNGELATVDLFDITQDGANFRLEGPWVQITDIANPNTPPPQQASSDFFFTREDDEFEAVNVYHHVDRLQRYIRADLGITNVVAFSIPADVHDQSTGGGAFYSPSANRLGFGDSGPTRPDRGEDGDVMVHEYGHAIQDDMVPGWGVFNATTLRSEAEAMGEGFGDALACIYHHETGGIFQPEVFEDWIFADVGGLRRVDGVKQYPGEGTTGTTGAWVDQVHSDGEIWSATLWNAYLAAGDSSSSATRATTRREFLRSLILHHNQLTTDATMPEAAEALLRQNAEDPQTLGRQVRALLDSFHDRNILRSAAGNVDLWISDQPGHTGQETIAGKFWDSPDVWIRNADDGGNTHQAPEFGQDNFFYARVRNRGNVTARAFAVTFEVKLWQGTQFVYPQDFIPAVATAVGFNLAPGNSQIVKARWPKAEVPAAGSHGCLLVSAYAPTDEALTGKHVWEANNLAQKNLTIVDLAPNDTADITFRIGNVLTSRPGLFRIEVARPLGQEALGVQIQHPNPEVVRTLAQSLTTIELEPTRPGTIGPGTIGIGRLPVGLPERISEISPLGIERTPTLTVLESSRVRLGVSGLARDDGDHDALELSLAPGSEIMLNNGVPEANGSTPAQPDMPRDPAFYRNDTTLTGDATDRNPLGINFQPGRVTGFPVVLPPRFQTPLTLRVRAPRGSRPGDTHTVDVVQRDRRGQIVGGISVQINVV